jgi:hypothetical protein
MTVLKHITNIDIYNVHSSYLSATDVMKIAIILSHYAQDISNTDRMHEPKPKIYTCMHY